MFILEFLVDVCRKKLCLTAFHIRKLLKVPTILTEIDMWILFPHLHLSECKCNPQLVSLPSNLHNAHGTHNICCRETVHVKCYYATLHSVRPSFVENMTLAIKNISGDNIIDLWLFVK